MFDEGYDTLVEGDYYDQVQEILEILGSEGQVTGNTQIMDLYDPGVDSGLALTRLHSLIHYPENGVELENVEGEDYIWALAQALHVTQTGSL